MAKTTVRNAVADAFDDLEELANEMQDAVDQLRQFAKPNVPDALAELKVTRSRRKSRSRLSNAYALLADTVGVLEQLVPDRCASSESSLEIADRSNDDARQLIEELDDAVTLLEDFPVAAEHA